ncbi:uncharacterized protein BDCG_16881 [Blastomyces dermatitidis ER-3]|uniref:Uncharacterized protein n=1 Tax=Ajellomyces dermatitidis (strain ER-3 / ATCC MYA-2586) TaxID=559297 RepID=A0ABX2VVA2_AJEDR|nr:uncharacterized protein BDCG_16881 [Blastomyces dermatitidis ER-3]OAT01062.1 hypothetical protein BDCG_16881 [Blastomyces dermatitidis ER-3]
MALRAFELDKTIAEEQSDEFNIYKDLVEGIISEMSGNVRGSSDQNNNGSVSKETCMRLEIARLQHEVECMKISRGETLASDEMRFLKNSEAKEEILLTAEQSETDDILEDNDLDENVIMNMQHF